MVEGLPPDERARIDAELILPLGVTTERLETAKAEWMKSHGW